MDMEGPAQNIATSQEIFRENCYQNYVARLNADLHIEPGRFNYIHLGQEYDTTYCGDYVLSVLMLLAKGMLNLNDPRSLTDLEERHLTQEDSKAIRFIAIQEFGEKYLWLQLSDAMKTKEIYNIFQRLPENIRVRKAFELEIDDMSEKSERVKRPKSFVNTDTAPKKPSPLRKMETAETLAIKNREKSSMQVHSAFFTPSRESGTVTQQGLTSETNPTKTTDEGFLFCAEVLD